MDLQSARATSFGDRFLAAPGVPENGELAIELGGGLTRILALGDEKRPWEKSAERPGKLRDCEELGLFGEIDLFNFAYMRNMRAINASPGRAG